MIQQFQAEITNLRKELSRTKQALILTKCEGKPSKGNEFYAVLVNTFFHISNRGPLFKLSFLLSFFYVQTLLY